MENDDLFDPNVSDTFHADTHVGRIRTQSKPVHARAMPRGTPKITKVMTVESGAMGAAYRTNVSEPGLGKHDDANRKLGEKTIDVGWNEVNSMGNVLVAVSGVALVLWLVARR